MPKPLAAITLACLCLAPSPGMSEPTAAKAAAAAAKANAAAMDRMMSTMEVKPSGDPDRDFARMMIPHHQGAIDMAKIELRYGHDPAMRALAEAVVAAQESEIATMKAFLAKPR